MSFSTEYEYEDELSVDPKLICAICFNPFTKPSITLCGHIFCASCIEDWLKKSLSCPICRRLFRTKPLKYVHNQDILNRLAELSVKCLICQQTQIKQKDFDDHINNQCPKLIVSCPAANLKCSWKGLREDLQYHRTIYHCHSNRKKFNDQTGVQIINANVQNSYFLRIENLIDQYPLHSKISLRDQQITDVAIPLIIKSAIVTKQCKILDLGNNQINSYGILQLAKSLQNNTTLKMLSLHQNSLSEMSILYLAEKLSLNTSVLKWLDLESTNLTDRSTEYLANMLMTNQSLTGLWLSNNQIGDYGIKMLTSILIYYNKTLKRLDLENNQSINDSSLDCLMDMLKQNRSLKKVYLNNCQLSITSKTKLRNLANTKTGFRLFL